MIQSCIQIMGHFEFDPNANPAPTYCSVHQFYNSYSQRFADYNNLWTICYQMKGNTMFNQCIEHIFFKLKRDWDMVLVWLVLLTLHRITTKFLT